MNASRIISGVVGAAIAIFVVRFAFSGGAPSVKDLKPYTAARISLLFPAEPKRFDIQLPANVRSLVKSTENYQYTARNFEAGVSQMIYADTVQVSMPGGVEGAIANVALKQGMTRVRDDKKDTVVSGRPAIRFTAFLRKDSTDVQIQGVAMTEGTTLWMVFVVYKDDATARETAAKIVDSAQIK